MKGKKMDIRDGEVRVNLTKPLRNKKEDKKDTDEQDDWRIAVNSYISLSRT